MTRHRRFDEQGQFTLIAIVLALLIVGILTAALVGTFVVPNDTSGSPTGTAGDVQAQSALSNAQTAAASMAASGGGYGHIDPAALSGVGTGVTFTSGPSTSAAVVSVANATSGSSAGSVGSAPSSGGGPRLPIVGTLPNISGNSGGTGSSTPPAASFPSSGSGGGSTTLAVYSSTGTCWYLWLGPGGPLYGAETGQSSCQATALTSPQGSAVSNTTIGWAHGGYPST